MDERTPLLPTITSSSRDLPTSTSLDASSNEFPTISSAAKVLLANPDTTTFQYLVDSSSSHLYPASLSRSRPIHAAAFRLAVIFYSLADDKKWRDSTTPLPTAQSTLQVFEACQDRITRRNELRSIAIVAWNELGKLIQDVLQHPDVYAEVVGNPSIEEALLVPFKEHNQSGNIRVLDLLYLPSTPQTILKDKLLMLSLTRLWKLGYPRNRLLSSASSVTAEYYVDRLQRVSDTVTSPRVIHGVHLLGHILYLIITAHFLLSPPHSLTTSSIGLRGSFMVIYSLANIVFNFWTISTLLHFLVVSSIISTTTSSPKVTAPSFPDSNAYILLLVAFCVHILLLHFPGHYPTHLLLFEPSRTLPKAAFYVASLRRGFLVAFQFLLPLFIICAVLFSLSMDGNFFNFIVISTTPPYNSRLAFILLLCAAFILLSHFSVCGLLLFSRPAMSEQDTATDGGWDDFDATSGIDARRSLVQGMTVYYPSYSLYRLSYPPPLNLLTLLLHTLPFLPQSIHTMLWALLVGPFAFLIAGFWGWELI